MANRVLGLFVAVARILRCQTAPVVPSLSLTVAESCANENKVIGAASAR